MRAVLGGLCGCANGSSRFLRSGWLLSPDASADEIVKAVGTLLEAPPRARALGEGARAVLESRHAWTDLAKRTLAFAESVRRWA